jgi:hypothetical protein
MSELVILFRIIRTEFPNVAWLIGSAPNAVKKKLLTLASVTPARDKANISFCGA